tara:strand:- start:9915 stop:10235 length:321 start_codon:yes stop_codon:yes gene_type:complete
MWLIINEAFLSIVKHRDKENYYLVRSRQESHITDNFGEDKLFTLPKADYPYRANVTTEELTDFLTKYVIERLTYSNFKGSLETQHFKRTCLSIWRFINDSYAHMRP